jgi:glutamyl-tRNA reductase
MPILLTGISHKTAPVALRERLAVAGGDGGPAVEVLLRLAQTVPVEECALIATCNRTEVYAVAAGTSAQEQVLGFLAEYAGLPAARLQPHVYCFDGAPAARHLLRVACGLDSMILGEAQIQAQVKEGLSRAQEAGTTGKVLDALFRTALSSGKRARQETEITRGAVSVSLAAVELARQIFGRLKGHAALVLGAGETGEQTARLLVQAGVDGRVMVCNRTLERAQEVATLFGGVAYSLEELPQALARASAGAVPSSSSISPFPGTWRRRWAIWTTSISTTSMIFREL